MRLAARGSQFRQTHPECGIADFENIITLGDDDRDVGCHPGLQSQIRIIHIDHCIVGDHILNRDRRVADLSDFAVERRAVIGIHGELDILPFLDISDIRLGNVGVDLHLGEIVGDDENNRRVQAGGNRLTHIDIAGYDDPINRGNNRAVLQIRARQCDGAFLGLHCSLGLMNRCDGLVETRLRGAVLGPQAL